jgi:hypothetical protein
MIQQINKVFENDHIKTKSEENDLGNDLKKQNQKESNHSYTKSDISFSKDSQNLTFLIEKQISFMFRY